LKVYLDDERATPDGWYRTYEPNQTIALLESGLVTHVSLDHDLGDDDIIGTGYDVVLWIEEQVMMNDFTPPKITVHSANPPAKKRMKQGIEQIRKAYEANCDDTGESR
jgi:hypothetical protein